MKGNRGLLLLVIALIAAGLVVFYFSYYGEEGEKRPTVQEAEEREAKANPEAASILPVDIFLMNCLLESFLLTCLQNPSLNYFSDQTTLEI